MTHQDMYLSCKLSRGPHAQLLLETADVSKPVFSLLSTSKSPPHCCQSDDSSRSLGRRLPRHLHYQLHEPGSKTVFYSLEILESRLPALSAYPVHTTATEACDHRTPRAGRDLQGSLSCTPGSTENHSKSKPYV